MPEAPKLSKLAQLKRGARPTKIIKWPGTDVDVALRVPTEAEWERARFEAWQALEGATKRGIDPDTTRGGILYTREATTRALFYALVDPASPTVQAPFCADLADLKAHATAEDLSILYREMADFTNEMDPDIDTEEGRIAAQELFDEIEKKRMGRADMELLLNGTRPRTLRLCIITMADRLWTLREAKSSPSSGSGNSAST
jgi:hypothetical protein